MRALVVSMFVLASTLGFIPAADAEAPPAPVLPDFVDFNGDSFADLAVGAPLDGVGDDGSDIDDLPYAGAVNVIYGSSVGLSSAGNQFWNQNTPGVGQVAEFDDQFGMALAMGDFDGDGFTDLAIGVPKEDLGGTADAGVVHVLYGSLTGLTATGSQVWHQNSSGIPGVVEKDDRFGFALATGLFNDDPYYDLAVGVPGDMVDGQDFAGAVNVLYGTPSGLNKNGAEIWHQNSAGIAGSAQESDGFGRSLAAANFGNGGRDDLAIGVPGESVNTGSSTAYSAGAVNVIYGSSTGLAAAGDQKWDQQSPGVPGVSETGDEMGFSLAAADFGSSSHADLAIGVPSESVDGSAQAGAVMILYGSAGAGLTSTGAKMWHQNSSGVPDSAEETDLFGYALSAGNFLGSEHGDLAVGSPGESLFGQAQAGAIVLLTGGAGGISSAGATLIHQDTSGVEDSVEARDQFGFALASADYDADGFADLSVGVPGEDVSGEGDAGAVATFYGSTGGFVMLRDQLWTQDSVGIAGNAEGWQSSCLICLGDNFGSALG